MIRHTTGHNRLRAEARSLRQRASRGFTLIEMMIVVVVIAILASIAYPSYDDYVRRARRADAQAALAELAQFMERHFTTNGSYAGATLPFNETPRDGTARYYDLTVATTATTYTLTATPKGRMLGDECGAMRLTQTGATSNTGTMAASQCWRR